jgi:hypothetical protein
MITRVCRWLILDTPFGARLSFTLAHRLLEISQ